MAELLISSSRNIRIKKRKLAGRSLVLRSNESRLDIGTGLIKILNAKQRRGCYWGCKKNHFVKYLRV